MGLKRSIPEAAKWYKKAVLHNNENSLSNLAILYEENENISMGPEAVASLRARAAALGSPYAKAPHTHTHTHMGDLLGTLTHIYTHAHIWAICCGTHTHTHIHKTDTHHKDTHTQT